MIYGIISLTAVFPCLDGRYGDKVSALRGIFSEYGLLKFRVQVSTLAAEISRAHGGDQEFLLLLPTQTVTGYALWQTSMKEDARALKPLSARITM